MALLYVALGVVLGGLSAVAIMAMLFVAKRADESEARIGSAMASAITPEEIT